MAARTLESSFYALSIWPGAIWWSADRNIVHIYTNPKAAQSRFSPISGPFWVRVGVRVWVRDNKGWVGLGGGSGLRPDLDPTREVSVFCSQTRTAHRPKHPGGQLC